MILAGDIGGTKTRPAFFEADGPRLRLSAEADFRSRDHADLAALLGAARHGADLLAG
jgi:hypothetical protein